MDFVVTLWATGAAGSATAASGVDLRVTAGRPVTVAELEPLVASALGMPRATLAWQGTSLPADLRCGQAPLRHGACLDVSSRPRPDPTRLRPADPPRALPTTSRAAVFDLAVTSGPDCGHRRPLEPAGLIIGRGGLADLTLADSGLSRRHAQVRPAADGVWLTDLGSTNGASVDGIPVGEGGIRIDRSSTVRAGRSTIRLRRPLATSTHEPTHDSPFVEITSVPTAYPEIPPVTLTTPPAPTPATRAGLPWVAMVVPLPIAAVLAAFFGPQFLLFALLGPVTMGATWLHERRSGGRRSRAEQREYAAALAAHDRATEQALAVEAAAWAIRCPDPVAVLDAAADPCGAVWRAPGADELRVRIGLGEPESALVSVQVRDPRSGDRREHPRHAQAPVVLDLVASSGLSVVGDPPRVASVLRCLIGQLAVAHSPDHLRVLVVGGTPWAWTRWLPHACVEDGRPVPVERPSDLDAAIAAYRPESGRLLIVVPDDDVRDEVRMAAWRHAAEDASITVLSGSARDGVGGARLRLGDDADVLVTEAPTSVVADGVGPWWAERLARALAPLRPARPRSGTGALTAWSLLDGGHGGGVAAGPPPGPGPDERLVGRTLARWGYAAGPAPPAVGLAPARALVGSGAQGPWIVDLDVDGPHLLIGGTTGSGKSEVIRALLLGLAAGAPPEQITFLVVDYKGGSTFTQARRLPHTVGVVSDLDPHLADRALRSLRAEVRRREEMLASVGAADLADYARHTGVERLPRLVVVIDEFRVLAQEHPSFLDGLVRLAAVGRSMGIHLILATQRPAGAITPDIQANVNLRIALRMRDRHDSEQVIGAPDAADLNPRTPGVGLARSGDGVLRRFRALHVTGTALVESLEPAVRVIGAAATPAPGGPREEGRPDGIPISVETRIVDVLLAAHARSGRPAPRTPWQTPLPDHLDIADVRSSAGPGRVPLGRSDHPDEQTQRALTWSPVDAPWRFVGGRGSGRTTALVTVVTEAVARFTPEEFQVYAVAAGRGLLPLADLPHVGAVIGVDELGRLRRLVRFLEEELGRRRNGETGPDLVLVVDDWDQVLVTGSPATGLLEPVVTAMAAAGAGGLTVIAAGGRALGMTRLLGSGQLLCLGGLDPGDLLVHGIRAGQMPSPWPPGRTVRVADQVEAQIAVPDARPTPRVASRRRPHPILDLPREVPLAALLGEPGGQLVLGVGDEGPCEWDPRSWGRSLLIAGGSGTGRTTALQTLAAQGERAGFKVVTLPRPMTPGGGMDASALTAEGPVLLLVDDADHLAPALEAEISMLLERLDDRASLLTVALRQHTLSTAFRGLAPTLAGRGTGLLLGPTSPHDGEPFGSRIEPPATACPGRGLLLIRGRTVEIQVAAATDPGAARHTPKPLDPR